MEGRGVKKIGEIIEKNDMWVISDEIHCDLLRLDQKHIPLGKVMPDYKKLVTSMAPSKTFNLAGLMISNVMIRDEGLKNIWLSKHYNFDNPLSIAAAQAAYEGGDAWLQELRAYLDGNFEFTQEYLKEHLPKATFRISEATYLAWVDLSKYLNRMKFFRCSLHTRQAFFSKAEICLYSIQMDLSA